MGCRCRFERTAARSTGAIRAWMMAVRPTHGQGHRHGHHDRHRQVASVPREADTDATNSTVCAPCLVQMDRRSWSQCGRAGGDGDRGRVRGARRPDRTGRGRAGKRGLRARGRGSQQRSSAGGYSGRCAAAVIPAPSRDEELRDRPIRLRRERPVV